MLKKMKLSLLTFLLISLQIVAAEKSERIQPEGQTVVVPSPDSVSRLPPALTNCMPPLDIESLENKARLKRTYYESLIREGFSKDEAFEILMREHILFN